MKCPHCHSNNVIKNGTAPRWKDGRKYRVQMYRCNNCGKQPIGDIIRGSK